MTTENIRDINREIDCSPQPEQLEIEYDENTGQIVEFHREVPVVEETV